MKPSYLEKVNCSDLICLEVIWNYHNFTESLGYILYIPKINKTEYLSKLLANETQMQEIERKMEELRCSKN